MNPLNDTIRAKVTKFKTQLTKEIGKKTYDRLLIEGFESRAEAAEITRLLAKMESE